MTMLSPKRDDSPRYNIVIRTKRISFVLAGPEDLTQIDTNRHSFQQLLTYRSTVKFW